MPENLSMSNSSLSVNATSVFLTKDLAAAVGGMGSSGAPSITCNTLGDGKWTAKSFSPGKSFLKIGASPSDCDLCLPQTQATAKVHCSLRLIFTNWFVLESAPERNMKVNGARRPQIVLKPGEGCALTIDGTEMLLQCSEAKDNAASAIPINPDKTVILKTQAADIKYSLDRSSVIGSDKSARLQFQELPPFAGVVFTVANKPFLHAFKLKEGTLMANGEDASEAPRELKHGAALTFAGRKLCHIILPDALTNAQPSSANLNFNGNLALLEVSSTRFGSKLRLPSAGRSITIGREADNHFIMESGSISKKHAQLLIYDNSVMVLDCKSTNGTFIEEEQISKKLLHPGEIVRFADKRFLLCHAE